MGIYDRDYERPGGSWDTGSGYRDGKQRSTNANLLITIGAVYVAQVLFQPWFTNALVLPSDWFREPWRVYGLLTYGLLHSTTNIGHLLFNGIALFFFGRTIEARYGGREYLAFFLAAVVFSGLVWSVVEASMAGGQGAVLLGASGGIAAVLVLFALNYPKQEVLIWGILPIPAWLLAVLFIGQDMLGAINRSGNIAYSAHLGGALFGYLYFQHQWRLGPWLPTSLPSAASLKRGPKLRVHHADEEPTGDGEEKRLDAILKKIHDQGIERLSRSERQFLEKASRSRKNED